MVKLFCLAVSSAVARGGATANKSLAVKPPLGWNSWDCWRGPGDQDRLYEAASVFADVLLPVGYDTMTIDMGWYYENSDAISKNSFTVEATQPQQMHIDKWGRLIANPKQWPDGIAGAAQHLHSLGIKMGIHVMRGINWMAISQNTPILDVSTGEASGYFAKDIATNQTCQWCDDYYGVNTSHPGAKMWYSSNAVLYKDMGIDFLKADCYYGKRDEVPTDEELQMFIESIHKHTGPVVISLSPGVNADTDEAVGVYDKVNMYRISDDMWDCWNDDSECVCDDGIRVSQQFERLHAHNLAGLIGAKGYLGKSWPDPDMLPVGAFADRQSALTISEQRVAMTLWSVARAPMMVGADLVKLAASNTTRETVANPEVLRVNQEALSSYQLFRSGATGVWGPGAQVSWVAKLPSNVSAIALFNLGDTEATLKVDFPSEAECSVRDLWEHQELGMVSGSYSRNMPARSAAFVTLTGCPPPVAPLDAEDESMAAAASQELSFGITV